MNFEQLHELAPLYVAGALDVDEQNLFETHLPDCERCQRDLREYESAMMLALESEIDPTAAPPPSLRSEVLRSIAETPQVEPDGGQGSAPVISLGDRRRTFERRLLAAAAAVVLLIGGTFIGSRLIGNDDPVELVADAPDAETLELEGEAGTLTVVYSPSLDQVALVGEGLGDPGAGKVYELWFVTEDGVSPAALFEPESGEIRDVFDVEDQVGTAGFGVTIEPEGGSEQPTGDILLVGTFEA